LDGTTQAPTQSSSRKFNRDVKWQEERSIGECGYIGEQEIEENQFMEEILAESEDEWIFWEALVMTFCTSCKTWTSVRREAL
jgi:hypothetical protein